MSLRSLLAQFDAWRDEGRALVLASVYETEGSTYSKAGARMLIADDGIFHGLLSGGCLEGDLAARAARVLADDRAEAVTYDLTGDEDELWGLGVGCDGLMRIFLQPLAPAQDYQPFAAMAECLRGRERGVAATLIAVGEASAHAPGATAVRAGERWVRPSDGAAPLIEPPPPVAEAAGEALRHGRSSLLRLPEADGGSVWLCGLLTPPPALLVLGAGLDAVPLVEAASRLGWRVTVADHRSAYLDRGGFRRIAERVIAAPAAELTGATELDDYAAAVVMSHHLETDRVYLRQLGDSAIAHVALLGPAHRRARLLEEIDAPASFRERVQGPAGLDIGGEGPEAIALSIAAGLQARLTGSPGGFLSRP